MGATLIREQLIMATRLTVPAVHGSAVSVVERWWAEDGDWVVAGAKICTLVHRPFAVTIRALDSGFLCVPEKVFRPAGSRVTRGELLGWIVGPGESIEDPEQPPWPAAVPALETVARRSEKLLAIAAAGAGKRPAVSPRARRYALQSGIEPEQLVGLRTTPLRERDVRKLGAASLAPREAHVRELFEAELHWTMPPEVSAPLAVVRAALIALLTMGNSFTAGCLVRWRPERLTQYVFSSPRHAVRAVTANDDLHEQRGRNKELQELSWLICDATESPFLSWSPGCEVGILPRAGVVIVLGALRPHYDSGRRHEPQHYTMRVVIACYRPDVAQAPWAKWLDRFHKQLSGHEIHPGPDDSG